MRINYVVSSMVFWWRENNLSLEQECEFLKSMGFGIELWPNTGGLADSRFDRQNWPRLIEATKGMLVAMHARNDGPSLEQWAEQIECAKLLNASIVADLESLGINGACRADNLGLCKEVVKMAEDNNIKFCIETGPLPKLKQLGEEFDSIWYCLDVGYINLDREFSFRQYVDRLAARVGHLHLTDNYGLSDDHEPPGLKGGIPHENWQYLLDSLNKYDNDIIGSFEMSPCMPDVMLRQASEFLFDRLNWPNRPEHQANPPEISFNNR